MSPDRLFCLRCDQRDGIGGRRALYEMYYAVHREGGFFPLRRAKTPGRMSYRRNL